jgi:hypothetical protein
MSRTSEAFLDIWTTALNRDPRLIPNQRRVAVCVAEHCTARITSYCIGEELTIDAWLARSCMDQLAEQFSWLAVADKTTKALTPALSLSAAVRTKPAKRPPSQPTHPTPRKPKPSSSSRPGKPPRLYDTNRQVPPVTLAAKPWTDE